MANQVRVRFAPSPSGSLHIGGARTALFNYAYARKHGGVFVVRIEDTDQARATPESRKIILDSLRWLGLDWNEGVDVGGDHGPYVQTERLDIYKHYANKLIAEGKAYRCYCSEFDLKTSRDEWKANNPKLGWKYPKTCQHRKDQPDKPFVIRLVAETEGTTEFTDKIFGKITTPNVENQDWIIIRDDGIPLYNFGAVIDDALMKITLVARGADHLQNTVPQIQMYKALGFDIPEFAHLPLIRGKNNEKLSKRHASVAVFEYRDNGYSPEAVLNYLARIGWSKGNNEVFSMTEFVDMFDWSGCGKNDGKFDSEKFLATQFAHLKSEKLTSNAQYAHGVLPFLFAAGIDDVNHAKVEAAIHTVRPRAKTFVEAASMLDFFFRKEMVPDAEAAAQFLTQEVKSKLQGAYKVLASTEQWDEATLKTNINSWLADMKMPMSDIGQSMRVAITGKTRSPDLFQVMNVLGKTTTLDRLAKQI